MVGKNIADTGSAGGEYSVLRPLLQGRVPNHPTIRVGDMGPEDRCGSDPRGFPSKVDLSDDGGGVLYSPLEEAMHKLEINIIETYITHNQKNIFQYIVSIPILELFMVVERHLGARVPK